MNETAKQWLELMDLQIGDEVMIVATGMGQGGFQGYLISLALTEDSGPVAIVISEDPTAGTRVTINWANVIMISRAKTPKGAVPSEPQDIDPEQMARFMDALNESSAGTVKPAA